MIPFMVGDFIILPEAVSFIVIIGLIIASIPERRQGYISRIGIVLNVLLLWQIFYNQWDKLPELLQLYLNLGTIIAVVAFIAYFPLTRFRLPGIVYSIAFWLYGSLSILLVVGYYFFNLVDFFLG